MAKKPPASEPSEPSEPTAAAAVAEVGVHPGDPIGTDEAPETTTAPATVATIHDGEQRPSVVDTVEALKTDVFNLAQTVNRMHLIITAMVNMPEHSSLSRPFAERCSGVLRGDVEVPKIQ